MAHKLEIERAHIDACLKNCSAVWLMQQLIDNSGCLKMAGNADPETRSYQQGWRDAGMQLVQNIVRDHGWCAVDAVMKGMTYDSSGAGRR